MGLFYFLQEQKSTGGRISYSARSKTTLHINGRNLREETGDSRQTLSEPGLHKLGTERRCQTVHRQLAVSKHAAEGESLAEICKHVTC